MSTEHRCDKCNRLLTTGLYSTPDESNFRFAEVAVKAIRKTETSFDGQGKYPIYAWDNREYDLCGVCWKKLQQFMEE
jgi:hypothetical protein